MDYSCRLKAPIYNKALIYGLLYMNQAYKQLPVSQSYFSLAWSRNENPVEVNFFLRSCFDETNEILCHGILEMTWFYKKTKMFHIVLMPNCGSFQKMLPFCCCLPKQPKNLFWVESYRHSACLVFCYYLLHFHCFKAFLTLTDQICCN